MAYGICERMFYESDRNHDGVLDKNEFHNLLDFNRADRNHDGRLTFTEFAQDSGTWILHTDWLVNVNPYIIVAPSLHVRPQRVVDAFRAADSNHDGILDARELADFADLQHGDKKHDGQPDSYEIRRYLGPKLDIGTSPWNE